MPNIEFIPLQLVDDYDKNSNTHPQAQIENIKALMLYVGWTVPALVRKTGERYGIIAGHGRRDAAVELQDKPLKMADGTPIPAGCIPVLFADGWSDEQIRAYVIADNQVPRQSVFDESILAEELQALQDGGLDLGMIGFDDDEVERLLPEKEELKEKTEVLRPIKMTRILISIPVDKKLLLIDDCIKEIIKSGGEVDYGGN